MPEDKLDSRFRKKVSQIIMLLENEKKSGKIDWHSREHLVRDAGAVATAANDKSKR